MAVGAAGLLTVPVFNCEACGEFEAKPELAHCWPSSPCEESGNIWFDEQVLQLYYQLKHEGGLSSSSFVKSFLATLKELPGFREVEVKAFNESFRSL